MRIVIDMQGLQEKRIDAKDTVDYVSLVKGFISHRGHHEVLLVLSGLLPESVEPLRARFFGLLPQENIRVWHAPSDNLGKFAKSVGRGQTVDIIRNAFISSLRPDFFSTVEHLMDQTNSNRQILSAQSAWSVVATEFIQSMEGSRNRRINAQSGGLRRLKIAVISPMPPQQSGISDHTAELIPHLAKYYDVEIIVPDSFYFDKNFPDHADYKISSWFLKNTSSYDRVLYHFGNSPFHQHMFDLLEQVPGVVVLHDFFLSNLILDQESRLSDRHSLKNQLYQSHGYPALHYAYSRNPQDTVWTYPCSIGVAQTSLGVIVHSNFALDTAKIWYGELENKFSVIPLVRSQENGPNKADAKKSLGFLEEDFILCSFGSVGPTKLNHRILNAWNSCSLAENPRCYLVFVGSIEPGDYGKLLERQISTSGLTNVRLVGRVETHEYAAYLSAADVAVQLRGISRGESSRALLDCMTYGIATITNMIRTLVDVPPDAVWPLDEDFEDHELAEALERLRSDKERIEIIGAMAREVVSKVNNPSRVSEAHYIEIERFYEDSLAEPGILANALASDLNFNPSDQEIFDLSKAVGRSFPLRPRQRCLFIDVSAIAGEDLKTGIQRVVTNIVSQFLRRGPQGYRVEPIAAGDSGIYRYARDFTHAFLGIPNLGLNDEPVEFVVGDVLLCLDLHVGVVTANRNTYRDLRIDGVTILFVVYDLLPLILPWAFPSGTKEAFQEWVEVVAENDGVICISRAVASDFSSWVEEHGVVLKKGFTIDNFPLGADGPKDSNSSARLALRESLPRGKDAIPTFLIVGTVEPRKGHEQVLSAFDELWENGHQLNLLIVGKEGWLVEGLANRIRTHREIGHHLVWLAEASDEVVAASYEASSCLLATSFGEGFGLPLIESALKNLPIIARDIPVFREVVGDRAFFFEGESPENIALAVMKWLTLYERNEHPRTDSLYQVTWEESAAELAKIIARRV